MGFGLGDILDVVSGLGGDSGGYSGNDLFNNMPDQGANEWGKLLGQNGAQAGELLGNMLPSQGVQDPITGISWIDNLLHGVGQSWEKNPLGVISGGLGILSAIDRMRSGNDSPGRSQMSDMVNKHVNSGANSASLAPSPVRSPYGSSAGQLIAIPQVQQTYTGPLTNTQYGRK